MGSNFVRGKTKTTTDAEDKIAALTFLARQCSCHCSSMEFFSVSFCFCFCVYEMSEQ